MRKLLYLVFVIPFGIILVTLALANRHDVRLVLDPLSPEAPALSLEAPFFIFLLGGVITGLALGGFLTWLKQGKWRKTARRRAREADELRRESERLTRQLEVTSRPSLPEAAAAD